MNTIEVTVQTDDGYSMNWKVPATDDEANHVAEVIEYEIERLRSKVRE